MRVKLTFRKGHEDDIKEMAYMMGDRSTAFEMGEIEYYSHGDMTMIVTVDKGFDMEIVEEAGQMLDGLVSAGMVF